MVKITKDKKVVVDCPESDFRLEYDEEIGDYVFRDTDTDFSISLGKLKRLISRIQSFQIGSVYFKINTQHLSDDDEQVIQLLAPELVIEIIGDRYLDISIDNYKYYIPLQNKGGE